MTISQGTNTLLGEDPAPIVAIRPSVGERRPAEIEGWDGRSSERVAAVLASIENPPLVTAEA